MALVEAERNAERADERYDDLYDYAQLPCATLDAAGTIKAVNKTGKRLLGLSGSATTGEQFSSLLFSSYRGAFERFLARAAAREDHDRSTCEVALATRKEPLHLRLTARRSGGTRREVLLTIEDVTEREQRQKDLGETLRVLNLSQHVARLGTFVMDLPEGTWTSSAALDEILGIDPHFERTRKALLALAHPEDRDALAAQLRSVLEGADRIDREYRIVHRGSGEVRWVWILGEVEYHGIEPVRLVGTLQDVTERRRLLQERDELLREAERASHAKDAFLAMLSHELRNPLAPISSSVHILEKAEPGSEQARRATSVMARQIRHVTRLVNDLLDVTRIMRGKVQLKRQKLDLNDLVRSVTDDHRSIFEGSGVHLEFAAAPVPSFVDGDRDRLAQVFGNLLQNAAKFCPRGGTTRAIVAQDGDEGVTVRVTDDGMGMSLETLQRLFQPFMQADKSLERSKGGLGLGLALAKGIVEIHGGTIIAHSGGPGKGAEFTVRLPRAAQAVAVAAAPQAARFRSRRRVLIIEDNIDAADSLRELLSMAGHDVTVSYSGHGGLARAREFRPEVVLCDIGLPGMDGYEVARVIRGDDALKNAYLVALTGYALPEDVRRAEASGYQAHVAKPPSPGALEELISALPDAPARARTGMAPSRAPAGTHRGDPSA